VAFDALLNLYAGDPAASADGDYKALGRNRMFEAIVWVGGDVTGTNPTLDVTIEADANRPGDGTEIAAVTQITNEMVGYIATATPRYEVPGESPLSVVFRTSLDYVRAVITIGGTDTPTFNDVSVRVRPLSEAYKRSGLA
jgi:hypothetical protein